MPTPKTCPRCQRSFVCQPEAIAECQCSAVLLSVEAREALAESGFLDCLCVECLREYQQVVGIK